MFLQKAGIPASDINQEITDQRLEIEKEVNTKILEISLKINDQYPELSKYLEELPVNFPVNKKQEITLKGLSSYYDSLNVLLNYHIKEHSINSNL